MTEELHQFIKRREKAETHFVEQTFTEQQTGTNAGSKRPWKRCTATQILKLYNRILLVGPPGSGKTENLQHFKFVAAISYLNSYETHFPVYINLRSVGEDDELLDLIDNQFCSVHEKQNHYRPLLLLLDELDGVVPGTRYKLVGQIRKISKRFTDARIIIASRVLYSEDHTILNNFVVIQVQPFDSDQINRYLGQSGIRNWERVRDSIATKRSIAQLIHNPLMLKISLQYADVFLSSDLVIDPTTFLEEALKKTFFRTEYVGDLDLRTVHLILEDIAGYLQLTDTSIMAIRDFESILESRIGSRLHASVSTSDVIHTLLQSSVLRQISSDKISFSHLNIYEYFLTKYIRRLMHSEQPNVVIDRNVTVLIGLKVTDITSKNVLKKILISCRSLISVSEKNFIPLYAQRGSLILLIAILGILAGGYAFKKFAEGFFTKLGQEAAKKRSATNKKIALPPELISSLPPWIARNPWARQRFAEELISNFARKTVNTQSESELARMAVKSVLLEKFGPYLHEVPVESILKPKKELTRINQSTQEFNNPNKKV